MHLLNLKVVFHWDETVTDELESKNWEKMCKFTRKNTKTDKLTNLSVTYGPNLPGIWTQITPKI